MITKKVSYFQDNYSVLDLLKRKQQKMMERPHKILLDIPARYQWENGHGFCGQTSIQSCALYYGSYLSQLALRKIGGSQILLGVNAQKTLQKLGFVIETWNSQSAQPQYKNYLQWIKKNIAEGHPVIVTGYQPQGKDQQYDHIYLAVGVDSQNYSKFNNEDTLIYADLFGQYTYTPFGKIWDNRRMQNNGKKLDFAIQEMVNYGIAVKGIKDKNSIFLPIRISLQDDSEPNLSLGEDSVDFQLKVRVSGLKVGVKYVLLRYKSFKKLPTDHIDAGQADKAIQFTAKGPIYDYIDVCDSSQTIFFRCVEQKYLQ